jgi:hypothetical protein
MCIAMLSCMFEGCMVSWIQHTSIEHPEQCEEVTVQLTMQPHNVQLTS